MSNRIDTALKNFFKKISLAETDVDMCRAVSSIEEENLRDHERYLIYYLIKHEFPEGFKINIRPRLSTPKLGKNIKDLKEVKERLMKIIKESE